MAVIPEVLWRKTVNFLRLRKRAYQLVFGGGSIAQQSVLIDLAVFCRANESCVVPGDHDRTLLLEGRREVWLRITQHLNLTGEQLAKLYNGQNYQPKE